MNTSLLGLNAQPGWNQIADSHGPHQPAIINPGDPLRITWQSSERTPWDNLYVYNKRIGVVPGPLVCYVLSVSISAQDLIHLNAFEFEIQFRYANQIYNLAWQADMVRRLWSVFNFAGHKWEPTAVPWQPFSSTIPNSIIAFYGCDVVSAHHYGLQFNGKYTPVNLSHNPVRETGNDYCSVAVQLDSMNDGHMFQDVQVYCGAIIQ